MFSIANTNHMKTFLLLFLIALPTHLFSQCPPYGKTDDPKERTLNVAKNKSAKYNASKTPTNVPLNTVITSRKEDDRNKFFPGAYVTVEGYLIDKTEEGGETCNCGLANASKKTGDVHIYIGLVPNAAKKNCMVVEITPSYKKLHPDYDQSLVKNKKVKVEGYLLYDYLHERNSVNFCNKCTGKAIWRKTCWEIHPVVKFDLLN